MPSLHNKMPTCCSMYRQLASYECIDICYSSKGDVKATKTKSTSTPTRENVPRAAWDISNITTMSGT
jgi:hypothetical protein